MLKQALGTAVAAVFATAIAGAQAPAQGQHEQRDHQAGQQMVTVEGCLQLDRAGAAQVADAARDEDARFLLVNAEIQQDAGAIAGATPRQGVEVGTTGQAERPTEAPVGTTGEAGAAAMTASKFEVAGLDEERLRQYEGQRVRIEGRIEQRDQAEQRDHAGVTGADRADRADDYRPESDRTTADPATGTGTAGTAGTTGTAGVESHDHSRAAAAGDVKKLKAESIQAVAGTCPASPASR